MRVLKNVLFVVFLTFLFFSLTKNIFDYRKKLKFFEDYRKDYEEEKKRNISLKTQILKNKDPNEVEKTIRNKLNLLKKDEVSIILPTPTPPFKGPTPTPAPVYYQWWQVFFKN